MAAKIRILDELTINKMAAGEVIENPSSVVKELIENSLDALSEQITVEIQAGGRLLIRVTDDGTGMGSDDALLSLERHRRLEIKVDRRSQYADLPWFPRGGGPLRRGLPNLPCGG